MKIMFFVNIILDNKFIFIEQITVLENNSSSSNVDQQTAALQRQTEVLQEQLSAVKRQHDQLAHRCSQLQDEASVRIMLICNILTYVHIISLLKCKNKIF